jgi:hypothetical protein
MSSQKIKVKQLKELLRQIIIDVINEASVTGNIDGGEGPPKTPYWVSQKKKKKKSGYGGGHKKPTVLGYMLAIDPELRKVN